MSDPLNFLNFLQDFSFLVPGTFNSPLIHRALLKVNGKEVPRGKAFRIGHIRRINQYDLVVWLELESNTKTEISMEHFK